MKRKNHSVESQCRPSRYLIALIACVFTAVSLPARAEDGESSDTTLSPYFLVVEEGGDPESRGVESFPLKSTKVNASISGTIVNVEVTQVYHNRGESTLEGIYTFPGSTRAAVHGLTMRVGEREIEAEIQEREKARETYEKAKRENKTASLLEQQRPNVFQMNVGHILPGDIVEVTLRYTEVLVPTERVYEFVYPTVVGPRYSKTPAATATDQEKWVENPFLSEGVDSPATFDIALKVAAGMPLQSLACDSHETVIEYENESTATVSLASPRGEAGNRDVIVRYRLAGDKVASGLLLHRDEELGENFFLLTVQPPKRITPEVIPPREYIFVVDVSGSMHGFPLQTAGALMEDLISGMKPTDRFNVLRFAGGSDVFAEAPVSASAENVGRAIRWMESSNAGGGTELVAALDRAMKLPGEENVSRSLVVVTDGYIDFENEAFDLIRNNLNRSNLFVFGIGGSVNRHLIEGMARVGRGEPFVVTDPKFAKKEAEKFRKYISSPVLTNVEVDFGEFDVYDVSPATVPDVLADRPIAVFGKWKGKPHGEIRVTGRSGSENEEMVVPIEGGNLENTALPLLWARDQIRTLSDYRGVGGSGDLKNQIIALGLKYRLLTEFTSFVAVDTEVRKSPDSEKGHTVKQPLPLPKGVSSHAVGGGTTPEPGIILLLLTGAAGFLSKRKKGNQ